MVSYIPSEKSNRESNRNEITHTALYIIQSALTSEFHRYLEATIGQKTLSTSNLTIIHMDMAYSALCRYL